MHVCFIQEVARVLPAIAAPEMRFRQISFWQYGMGESIL